MCSTQVMGACTVRVLTRGILGTACVTSLHLGRTVICVIVLRKVWEEVRIIKSFINACVNFFIEHEYVNNLGNYGLCTAQADDLAYTLAGSLSVDFIFHPPAIR